MLQSKQSLWYHQLFEFNGPESLQRMWNKGSEELVRFLQPEDTTDQVDSVGDKAVWIEADRLHSISKTLFWLAASIIISLALGQLG